jgi:hypothetical protein
VFRVAMTTRGPRVGVAATRGVSANDPRPNASSANAARACLEHLCECLRALGVGTAGASRDPTALTAETLRRAKFDQPSSVAPLWRALHDLFLVAHAGFPEPSVAAETLRVLRDETAESVPIGREKRPRRRRRWTTRTKKSTRASRDASCVWRSTPGCTSYHIEMTTIEMTAKRTVAERFSWRSRGRRARWTCTRARARRPERGGVGNVPHKRRKRFETLVNENGAFSKGIVSGRRRSCLRTARTRRRARRAPS